MDNNGMMWEFVPRDDVDNDIKYHDGIRQHAGFLIYAEPGDLAEYYADHERLGHISNWYHIEVYWVDNMNCFMFHLHLVQAEATAITQSEVRALKKELATFVAEEIL